ncbi:hypothetical protein GJAV_G00220180 [Gymnothorax javanicus]|nr:hypothetical protein GJAV_G00220180 [Gymnothorax javanicus]
MSDVIVDHLEFGRSATVLRSQRLRKRAIMGLWLIQSLDPTMVDSNATRRALVVPDVKPSDQYDFTRAKICASLGWLMAKSYGTTENVPEDLRDPFYTDQYEQEHMKPPVTRLLMSCELYCRTYSLLQAYRTRADDASTLLSLLASHGLSPRDQDAMVTEADLRKKPISMTAHLAVIDSLMAVGAMETVTVAKIPSGAEQLGSRAGWENALLYWVNRVNQKLTEITESAASTDQQGSHLSSRYKKDKLTKQASAMPLVTDVSDLTDGVVLATVIHFYCPSLLSLEEVCVKDTMQEADSVYNLQLIRKFCDTFLDNCCPLVLEDLLYNKPTLRVNIMSLVAELLEWFELRKPDFVQPLGTLDLSDTSELSKYMMPTSEANNSTPPNIFNQPFLPISATKPGSLTQSTSLTEVGSSRTWTKKPPSRPLSGVSFSIPFGLDSDVEVVMGNPVGNVPRSVSSGSLPHVPFSPPEDLAHPHSKTGAPVGPVPQNGPLSQQQRAAWGAPPTPAPHAEASELPTIEEALQIIHNEAKLEPRLHPEGAPDGFYLHSPDDSAPPSSSGPSRSGTPCRPSSSTRNRDRHASDGSRDDDSVLRDGSVDSDASEDLPKTQSTATTPASSTRSAPSTPCTSDSGVKMTSFAERKKKQSSNPPAWEVPSNSPASNMETSELGQRLEEKRRAIEAQKKRIEAIFQKHRERLGKSAALQLRKQQDEGVAGAGNGTEEDQRSVSLEERLARIEDEELPDEGVDTAREEGVEPLPREKGVGSGEDESVEKGVGLEEKGAAPLGDYNNAVSRLTAALTSLQSDMQRLSEQQHQLTRKKNPSANKAWVIPASPKSPTATTPPRLSRESTRNLPSHSPSPSRKASYAAPAKSPKVSHRRAQSAPPKSPKLSHNRPTDLRVPPLTRVLTPPQNVDNIPHLRRVTPNQCQMQTSSSFTIGTPRRPREPQPQDTVSEAGSCDTLLSLELDSSSIRTAGGAGSSSGAPSECSFDSDIPAAFGTNRGSLIEISLRSLQGGETDDPDDVPDAFSDSMSDQMEPEARGGVGFFFKDEARPEDEMAQRRAALLEKQQKRAEEMKRRREQERESRLSSSDDRPLTPSTPPASRTPRTPSTPPAPRTPRTPSTPPALRAPSTEATPVRRGDFTRQEYQRRHQLKIMEDLDKVLRQKPTTVRGVKKQRPKSLFRDDSALSRSPAKGLMGSKMSRVYSHSSHNLSTLSSDHSNTGTLTIRKSPSRSHSPARLMSPSRMSLQNGERDWDLASTVSSSASIPEYTGPKLYKEPSFKSNKFIIQNALSRCCLAGKVNEPQKNKILEEMEDCTANHFLILFRDSSCQFRAVYAMNPETEEMVRVTGIGPRVIGAGMVESIYKYSSDRKQFTAIPSKTMSMSVDAFTIPNYLWQSRRPGTPKKLGTPK